MITELTQVRPDPAELVGDATESHPIRKVTRQIAFEADAWTPERAAHVKQLFDGLAPEWSQRFRDGRMDSLHDALDRGGVAEAFAQSGGAVVELGSGTGFGTAVLSERLGEVAAMDLSLEMLRHAPTTAPRVQADASSLPLAAGTVGVLVAVNMFLFPLEVDRVLAAGGVLLWVSSLAERTPIYLSAADVRAALPGDWAGVAARAGGGSWCVMRRTSATAGQSS